jgi:hypothetical protein
LRGDGNQGVVDESTAGDSFFFLASKAYRRLDEPRPEDDALGVYDELVIVL